jgi:hypothetical protein
MFGHRVRVGDDQFSSDSLPRQVAQLIAEVEALKQRVAELEVALKDEAPFAQPVTRHEVEAWLSRRES